MHSDYIVEDILYKSKQNKSNIKINGIQLLATSREIIVGDAGTLRLL